jgi:hypothetical protein
VSKTRVFLGGDTSVEETMKETIQW